MSSAYSESVRIGSQTGPDPGMSKETWLRHKQVAGDTRLAALDPSILPNTFSALYELSKMSGTMIGWIVDLDLLGPFTTSRFLKDIRVRGMVRLETVLEVPLGKVELARDRIAEMMDELG